MHKSKPKKHHHHQHTQVSPLSMLLLQTLQTDQLAVPALERHELRVRPTLSDLALVDDVDDVGLLDCAQPVRDGDRRPSFRRHVERVLDHLLRLGVEGRGRLVEEQDLGVAQQGARDGDALLLAARQEGRFAAAVGGETIAGGRE